MNPDEIMAAYKEWLRAETTEDNGPREDWSESVRDRFHTSIGAMAHFTAHLKARMEE